jgi:acyl-coenzyme A synthetase/AMP-(fatty) acid ligase
VVADVVLKGAATAAMPAREEREILGHLPGDLAAHKVPAAIRFVPALDVTAAGKLRP